MVSLLSWKSTESVYRHIFSPFMFVLSSVGWSLSTVLSCRIIIFCELYWSCRSKEGFVSHLVCSIDGIYFTPSVIESFIHSTLTLHFHQNATGVSCSSWTDCLSIENGYCVKGHCYASNAYYHDALDPAIHGNRLRRGLI